MKIALSLEHLDRVKEGFSSTNDSNRQKWCVNYSGVFNGSSVGLQLYVNHPSQVLSTTVDIRIPDDQLAPANTKAEGGDFSPNVEE